MARVFPLGEGALGNWAFYTPGSAGSTLPLMRYVAWNDCWPGCGGVMASRWHPGLDPWPHSSMCCKPMIGSETNNHSQPMRNHYLLLERDET